MIQKVCWLWLHDANEVRAERAAFVQLWRRARSGRATVMTAYTTKRNGGFRGIRMRRNIK